MTAFKKETLQHIILSRCRVMVLLKQYIQQLGTDGGAIPIQSAEGTKVAPCIMLLSSLLQPKLSCVSVHQQNQQPSSGSAEGICLMSTHPSIDLPLLTPVPCSGMPGEPWGSPSLQARQSFGLGAGEVRTKEGKRKGMKGSGFCLLRSSQEERKITA